MIGVHIILRNFEVILTYPKYRNMYMIIIKGSQTVENHLCNSNLFKLGFLFKRNERCKFKNIS